MLVLTRKLMESITINGDIVVTVLKIHGNQVRLGIKAAAPIPIHRTELLEMILGSPTSPVPDCIIPAA